MSDVTGDDKVLLERYGAVARITLNEPQTRNAVSEPPVLERLLAVLAEVEADAGLGAAVLTGSGKAFSAGGNIKAMHERTGMFAGTGEQMRENYRYGIQQLTRRMSRMELPLIAAVNGPAYGAGCDLALLCDLRVANREATFAHNFVRLGIIAGDGGAWLLPRIVGTARAHEMALTGDPVDAETAREWGLVNRVVEADALLPAAHELAERIARNPRGAVRKTKSLLRHGQRMDLETTLELSAAYQALAHDTQEHVEAVQTFIDRRRP